MIQSLSFDSIHDIKTMMKVTANMKKKNNEMRSARITILGSLT